MPGMSWSSESNASMDCSRNGLGMNITSRQKVLLPKLPMPCPSLDQCSKTSTQRLGAPILRSLSTATDCQKKIAACQAGMQRLMKNFQSMADPSFLPVAKDSVKKCKLMASAKALAPWEECSRTDGCGPNRARRKRSPPLPTNWPESSATSLLPRRPTMTACLLKLRSGAESDRRTGPRLKLGPKHSAPP